MPIRPGEHINKIRRIGDDQIERPRNPLEQVTFDDRHIGHRIERRIYFTEAKGTGIDVREGYGRSQLGGPRRRVKAAGTAAGAHVQNAQGVVKAVKPDVIDGVVDEARETIRIRSEEHRVGSFSRKGRMHEGLRIQRREPHDAAQRRSAPFENARIRQTPQNVRGDFADGKCPISSEYVLERTWAVAVTRLRNRLWLAGEMVVKR